MAAFTTSNMLSASTLDAISDEELGRILRQQWLRSPIEVPPQLKEQRVPLLACPTTSQFALTNSMQLSVWAIRYRNWDQNSGVSFESIPEQTFVRVAEELAWVRRQYEPTCTEDELREDAQRFFDVMARKQFMPAGRTLADAGTGRKVVSNCVVLGIDDQLTNGPRSIMATLQEAVKLQCQGCGLGFAWHTLRPYGTEVVSGRTTSSGIVSYLNLYASMFATVKQTNSRHGANMGMCLITHPEVPEFVRAKDREGGDTAVFNITVLLTDEFMERATDPTHPKFHEPWMCHYQVPERHPSGVGTLRDPENGNKEVMIEVQERPFFIVRSTDLFKDRDGRPTSTWGRSAREEFALKVGDKYYPNWTANQLMEHIARHAWSNGEPGFGFYDEVQRTNPLPGLGPIEASNPCGEQFLHDGDVCNLGSINLAEFCCKRRKYRGKQSRYVDYALLAQVTATAIEMLDNVIDITQFNSDRVQKRIRENRRVGLGIMGFADACYKMRVRYGSDEAEKLANDMMRAVNEAAHEASRAIAARRGSFPNIELSVFWKPDAPAEESLMRNAACTTVAPTGTISAFTGVCGGCEPYFAPAYHYSNIMKINSNQVQWVEEAMRECCRNSSVPEMRALVDQINLSVPHAIGPHPEFQAWMEEMGLSVRRSLSSLARARMDSDLVPAWLSRLPKGIDGNMSLYDALVQQSSYKPFEALIPKAVMEVFGATSQEISVQDHIRMQAAFQRHTDNSMSKTLNLVNSASVQDVRDTIEAAWRARLKGCTLYRDGSRNEQVLNLNNMNAAPDDDMDRHRGKSLPINQVRFQDLVSTASPQQYRDMFASASKNGMISVEMTPRELADAVRAWINQTETRNANKAHRAAASQIDALEHGLRQLRLGESSTDNSSDEDDPSSAAAASSSSSSSSSEHHHNLSRSPDPRATPLNLLRMSADGSPMCTRGGCGQE